MYTAGVEPFHSDLRSGLPNPHCMSRFYLRHYVNDDARVVCVNVNYCEQHLGVLTEHLSLRFLASSC